ncbi:prepilin peptidase [Butyrivibrio sp.]|uniref:prepilin peptidase n=1 Tax=Butyrivibrio sp. TaxID=28121 RepID=UPI0025C10AF0|nr:A24 family peptidase [Butyrivibrio sp.]
MFLTGAVFTDLFKDKIFNAWVIPALSTGVISSLIQGSDRLFESLSAVGVAFLILLPVYFLKGIAAGDVKLFMSAASFLSVSDTLSCILVSFFIAGIISVLVIIFKRNKQKTIHFAIPVLVSVLFVMGGIL